jgi:hypothetical protein
MSYTPPTVFTDGTILTAAALEGNAEALRVYLHRGIVAGDLAATKWIDTRHVQPPEVEPYSGVQHGVTGHQGGQWAGGSNIRMTFATKYLSGNGRRSSAVHNIPNTSFTLDIRRSAKILFHYWWDLENGKDESTATYQAAVEDRQVFIMPYFGSIRNAIGSFGDRAQETRNNEDGVSAGYPIGLDETLVGGGGYGSKQGTLAVDYAGVGRASFGLAAHSLTDRCGIVEWGVSIEAFYL